MSVKQIVYHCSYRFVLFSRLLRQPVLGFFADSPADSHRLLAEALASGSFSGSSSSHA